MAEKSIKKTSTKKTVAKKSVSKPAGTKKTATKKVAAAPVIEMHECGCAHGCACHGHCCDKKKCSFGRFLKKIVIFLIIFVLGFATAKLCVFGDCGQKKFHPEFQNGCLVVKCPKMAEKVSMMDANKDGCINREEFRAARKMHKRPNMRKHHRNPKPAAPEMPAPETVVTE